MAGISEVGVSVVHCPKLYWHTNKVTEYKIIIMIFLYNSNEKIKNEILKNVHLQ